MTSVFSNRFIFRFKLFSLIFFGLSLLFLPGQNHYLSLQSLPQPPRVRPLEADLPPVAALPLLNGDAGAPPWVSARSALVLDRDSAVALFEKNPRSRLLPASTVKIMTALVSLDHYPLDRILTVFSVNDDGQDVGLQAGERLTAESLLNALLVASGNDAAQVLAQNFPGGQTAFVAAMNQKAIGFNLVDTYFANPTGLDSSEFGPLWSDHSYTTTLDLARLTVEALRDPTFARIVQTPRLNIHDATGQIVHPLYNLNQLLGRVEGLKGVKTGWTEEAGECLVSFVERGSRGVVVVVLGSRDRFGESSRLIEWAFANYHWLDLAEPQST